MGFRSSLYKKYSLIFIFSVILISILLIYAANKILKNEMKTRGELVASILASITADAILTYDYVTLERYVNELIKNKDFLRIKITNNEKKVIIDINKNLDKDISGVYSIEYPIYIDNDPFGSIYIEFSTEQIDKVLRNIGIGGVIFILLIHFIGLFINNTIIKRLVFNPIDKLIEGTKQISKGNYDLKIYTGTEDEFSKLAEAFNEMSEKIKNNIIEILEKQKEIELHKNKLETIIENIADGLFVTNTSDIIIEFNKSAEKITGYNRNEVIGKHCEEVFKTDLCKKTCALRNIKKEIVNRETTLITKEGKERIVSVSSAIINDIYSNPLFGVQTFKDITDDKKNQAMLLHTEKLAAVGEMVSAIAHEVNNPLTNIIGYSKLLLNKKDIEKTIYEKIEIINEQANKSAAIVQELLNFSRHPDRETEISDLKSIIENIIKITSIYTYDKDIKISASYSTENNLILKCNPTKIEQILFNIIINAIQSIESENGEINISVINNEDGYLEISIRDNGIGIDDKYIHEIFQPFFTTKPKGKGTGLGLFIVRNIIEELGGDIEVQSKLGQGSTFKIKLKGD
jgi:PAS domain S-box-containing protein